MKMNMRNEGLSSILDVKVKCPLCKWIGDVGSCEPDVDGDGSLECPKCMCVVCAEEANVKKS